MIHELFISCPRNMEYLLEAELIPLGLEVTKVSPMGIYGDADLATLYNICLCSRIGNRVQLILFQGEAADKTAFNALCHDYDWKQVFSNDKTIAIDFHGETDFINNTMYGAQLIKDGVVDYFAAFGDRPNVDKRNPDILLHGHMKNKKLTVSLDLLGYSMHQRGYRDTAGQAPIKENVAAAMLIRSGWPALAEQGYRLVDPFCGSGTIAIEAAMMAANIAPGLLRTDQALPHWHGHDPELWQATIATLRQQQVEISLSIDGMDCDARVLQIAQENAEKAGVAQWITFKQQAIADFQSLSGPGLLVCNPPYGERLGDPIGLLPLYQALGSALSEHCRGWQAAVLTSESMLAQAIGLRLDKQYRFYNGLLKVQLYCILMDEDNNLKVSNDVNLNPGMQALVNRLKKNKKHLSKWLKRSQVTCYRLYDADLPEYAFAIDIYHDWVHVQEYAPPKEVPENKAKKRVVEMLQVLPMVLDVPSAHIVLKQRRRQKGRDQYQALAKKQETFVVTEGRAKLKVNLKDYLDTGLFLDHRLLRQEFSQTLRGKRFLNCFCYTAAVSVHAALGGAKTCNVDMSYTYLNWAKDNFRLNHLSINQHQFIQADCLQWLEKCDQTFDVIFLDPPSFSNSKRMESTLDIQRDQNQLVDLAMKLLAPAGKLYFSNNLRKFKLSAEIQRNYSVKDITQQTIDEDFKRHKLSHHCYLLTSLPKS